MGPSKDLFPTRFPEQREWVFRYFSHTVAAYIVLVMSSKRPALYSE